MISGCYTALITPLDKGRVDEEGLDRLVEFQMTNGVTGIVAMGTTGESPAFDWQEHNQVTERIVRAMKGRGMCIAGSGSNSTVETLEATGHAAKAGARAMLLVDPYYNGPSSLEIRKEYIEPVAERFPDTTIIPYLVPGRTGTQLLPEDLALAAERFPNIGAVKDATGSFDNMKRIRHCCGEKMAILSGDDNLTCRMMSDPQIRACGVISVYANIFPRALSEMVAAMARGRGEVALGLEKQLSPLLELVTVTTTETTPHGPVSCRARNPLPVKTLMAVLGMPSGSCRRPLGRMTAAGLEKLLAATRTMFSASPELFAPMADFFKVDVASRLNDTARIRQLVYESY
ncbi:MAG: 4-hydroxy-tetrahydrodipicolinate synthase [Thermodesulfobacteriota bacterium]